MKLTPSTRPSNRPRSLSCLARFTPTCGVILGLTLCVRIGPIEASPPAGTIRSAPQSAIEVRSPFETGLARSADPRSGIRSDTLDFGFYEIRPDGEAYAVQGERWSFDHGAPDPLEGWSSNDLTENDRDFWHHLDEATWTAEGNPLPWPQMSGSGLALCGAGKNLTDTLRWEAGIGYGNNWCQRLTSPLLTYDGSGSVQLSLAYFNETELDYDYSKVLVQIGDVRTTLNAPGFAGIIGVGPTGEITPQGWNHAITNEELGGGTLVRPFRLVLEVQSDGGCSDEDGVSGWDARYGAFGADDVVIDGANLIPPAPVAYGFETDLEGWTAGHCPGVGSYFGVAPLGLYGLPDYCECGMAGNVIEFHDDDRTHPNGQYEMATSPIFDREDLGPDYLDYNVILGEAQVSASAFEWGLYYRIGWSYYPYEVPDARGSWAGRLGWVPPSPTTR